VTAGQWSRVCDNHPRLLHRQIADILGVTAQLVSRFAKLRAKQLNIARKTQARAKSTLLMIDRTTNLQRCRSYTMDHGRLSVDATQACRLRP
jgi:hypothetical protein